MCGIGACVVKDSNKGHEYIKKILLGQEKRGMASSGVAYIDGKEVKVLKDTVKPSKFVDFIEFIDVNSTMLICHSRKPTIGTICMENTHPFLSCDKKFALVHNGTFKPHNLLKKHLLGSHFIRGNTDSEIIMHFIEDYSRKIEYKDILSIFKHERILLLFKDRIIGTADNIYIAENDDGYFVFQEKRLFKNIKGKLKKYSGVFEITKRGIKY